MKPILTVELPYLQILKLLDELSRVLCSKGLLDGWDALQVTVNHTALSWNQLIRVFF